MHEHLLVRTPAETVIILKMLQQQNVNLNVYWRLGCRVHVSLSSRHLYNLKKLPAFWFHRSSYIYVVIMLQVESEWWRGTSTCEVWCFLATFLRWRGIVYLVSACESVLLFGLWLCAKKKTTFSSSACVHNDELTTGELGAFLCLSFWKV